MGKVKGRKLNQSLAMARFRGLGGPIFAVEITIICMMGTSSTHTHIISIHILCNLFIQKQM